MFKHFERLGKHTIWYGGAKVVSTLIVLVLVPFLTRSFSPSEYGIIELALTLIMALGSLFMMGFDSALAVYFYQAEEDHARKKMLSTALYFLFGTVLVIVLLLILFRHPLSEVVFRESGMSTIIVLVAVASFFHVLNNFFSNILRFHFKPFHYFYLVAIQALLFIGFVLFFTLQTPWGIGGVLGGYLLANFIIALLGFALTFSDYIIAFSSSILISLLKFGFPLLFVVLSEWVLHLTDRLFLVYFWGPEQVGLYSLGFRISQVILFAVGSFQLAWVPLALSMHKEKDAPRIFALVLTYFTIGACALALSITVFAKEIISIVSTPLYQNVSSVVGPLSLGLVAYGSYSIFALGVMITRKTSRIAWTSGGAALLNIVLNFVLVPRLGMVGAALATVSSYGISALLLYVVSQRLYPIPFQIKKVGVIWAITIFLMIVGSGIQSKFIALTIILKFTIPMAFALALLFLGVVRKKEFGLLLQFARRILPGKK